MPKKNNLSIKKSGVWKTRIGLIIGVSAVFCIPAFGVPATTYNVTYGGISYNITNSAPLNYTANPSFFTSQPIWGNAALSNALATTVGANLGLVQFGIGPLFGYATNSGYVSIDYYDGSSVIHCPINCPTLSGNYIYANVSLANTNIINAGGNYLSAVNNGLNPSFSGGTLTLLANDSSSQNFTLNAGGGTLESPSSSTATLSGDFSGVGKLTINGSGTIVLSGNNTYSGGTQVDAGSTLSINSGSALGSGQLTLNGTSTTPATLTTTATTTINNAITVAGDPVFNVAPNTTTTITSPISDGALPGDVVIAGGGTLELMAVNTYTGLTNINADSTLALTGNGSISTSNAVSNNGTFNIAAASNVVNLGGSFTQSSTGNLVMFGAPNAFQKLNISGLASLDGALTINNSTGVYSIGKYTVLTANGVSGQFSRFLSNFNSPLGSYLSYDANNVYLNFTPSSAETQSALQANVSALQGVYALQTGAVNNSLGYDCSYFNNKGFCVSTGGRYSNASGSNANTTSAMVIAGYRINDHLRVGGSIDQNLYNTDVAKIASVRSNTPLMNAFIVWNQKADRTGFEAKLASSYNNSDLNVNRMAVGTSELGLGSTSLNTLAESLTTSYGFKIGDNWMTSPYVGFRYTSVSANGYTEKNMISAPLAYNGLSQESTTALLGVRLSGQVWKHTNVQASAGFEEDIQNSVSNYTASGLSGLTPITFNPNIQRTRAVATFGSSYEVAKGHQVGFNAIYRQESFQSVDTKMAYVNYTLSF